MPGSARKFHSRNKFVKKRKAANNFKARLPPGSVDEERDGSPAAAADVSLSGVCDAPTDNSRVCNQGKKPLRVDQRNVQMKIGAPCHPPHPPTERFAESPEAADGELGLAGLPACDPMNFGAVLRSSCYFGVQKIFMPSKDSCRLSPTVSKASSGALELMDLYVLQTPERFMAALKAKGWWIVGTSSFNDSTRQASGSESRKLTWDLPPPDRPVMLIVGNEGQGVQPELSALCDSVLCVAPLEEDSPIGSLNVSVATGWFRSSQHEHCCIEDITNPTRSFATAPASPTELTFIDQQGYIAPTTASPPPPETLDESKFYKFSQG
ncbi:hypothetical protein HPB49_007054 [Dermacentor silvarum]|uniref:Uncharacterized protein n=1 Tax=Dermacentor silvarum TaxID=543639 RepID=A0ACB8D3Y1_DERSI|nr:hypothetical protein HPB49_007054 [Dermacentor silvarum]